MMRVLLVFTRVASFAATKFIYSLNGKCHRGRKNLATAVACDARATWDWWENDFITPDPLIDDFPDKIVVSKNQIPSSPDWSNP